ncbi:Cytochrome c-552 [Pandoraea terrae]|uniref:Cytochrome c-552 n=1 Tax=Pandoraea terrae TaxID=1537710 RepID=A0A5E4RTS1_9BURK|nr:cytochrome c [Pandoraea terrae]VVD65459.1 Cytochrome c-552 [Pandoraea terrae]
MKAHHRRLLAVALALGVAAPAAFGQAVDAARASRNYVLNCMGCHGANSAGVPGKIPPMQHALGYFMYLPAGREFAVRVPGSSNSSLDDAQLAEVLNWLLQTFNRDELPPDFKPYTAQEVSRLRRPAYGDVKTQRSQVIEQLHAHGVTKIQ